MLLIYLVNNFLDEITNLKNIIILTCYRLFTLDVSTVATKQLAIGNPQTKTPTK